MVRASAGGARSCLQLFRAPHRRSRTVGVSGRAQKRKQKESVYFLGARNSKLLSQMETRARALLSDKISVGHRNKYIHSHQDSPLVLRLCPGSSVTLGSKTWDLM